jgi:hypothetical protein
MALHLLLPENLLDKLKVTIGFLINSVRLSYTLYTVITHMRDKFNEKTYGDFQLVQEIFR